MLVTTIAQLHPHRRIAISIGVVYLYFGILKFFAGASPAEDLAQITISHLSFGVIPPAASIILLAVWETFVGAMLLSGYFKKLTIIVALVHMALTFSPLILFPEQTFNGDLVPSLLGQYIMKNIIIIAALVAIYPSNKKV